MTRTYRLKNLDCANCAAKIEREVGKLPGVTVSVNFMTTKMILEAPDETFDDTLRQAETIIHKFEPDVVVQRA
jgi:copper chaperone CopZ